MKTKIEIINECVAHIESNGRSTTGKNGLCFYKNEEGNRCGHSIFVKDEIVNNLKLNELNCSADRIISIYSDSCHKDGYTGHEPHFWLDIQSLHDKSGYWEININKLNHYGVDYVKFLKDKYKNG